MCQWICQLLPKIWQRRDSLGTDIRFRLFRDQLRQGNPCLRLSWRLCASILLFTAILSGDKVWAIQTGMECGNLSFHEGNELIDAFDRLKAENLLRKPILHFRVGDLDQLQAALTIAQIARQRRGLPPIDYMTAFWKSSRHFHPNHRDLHAFTWVLNNAHVFPEGTQISFQYLFDGNLDILTPRPLSLQKESKFDVYAIVMTYEWRSLSELYVPNEVPPPDFVRYWVYKSSDAVETHLMRPSDFNEEVVIGSQPNFTRNGKQTVRYNRDLSHKGEEEPYEGDYRAGIVAGVVQILVPRNE